MSDVMDSSAGVWQHISQRTPAPERDEIAQLIGHKIIDQNKVRPIILMEKYWWVSLISILFYIRTCSWN